MYKCGVYGKVDVCVCSLYTCTVLGNIFRYLMYRNEALFPNDHWEARRNHNCDKWRSKNQNNVLYNTRWVQ